MVSTIYLVLLLIGLGVSYSLLAYLRHNETKHEQEKIQRIIERESEHE